MICFSLFLFTCDKICARWMKAEVTSCKIVVGCFNGD